LVIAEWGIEIMEKNIIYNMDCIEGMKELPSGCIDMVLTDPPYGTTACKWDSVIPIKPMWEQLHRVIKPNGAIVMTASQPFTTTLIASNIKMFKYEWIWEKDNGTNFPTVNYQPFRVHENILVFGDFHTSFRKDVKPNYRPQFSEGKPYKCVSGAQITDSLNKWKGKGGGWETDNKGKRFPRSVVKMNRDKKTVHPTQKPVALMEYLIKTYTNEGETVLDFTIGSGTTAVACQNLNRNFIGFELDPEYCKIARDRIKYTRKKML